jgi:hypothetical protein
MATKGLSNISVNTRMKQLLMLIALIMVGILVTMVSADGEPSLKIDSLKSDVRSTKG